MCQNLVLSFGKVSASRPVPKTPFVTSFITFIIMLGRASRTVTSVDPIAFLARQSLLPLSRFEKAIAVFLIYDCGRARCEVPTDKNGEPEGSPSTATQISVVRSCTSASGSPNADGSRTPDSTARTLD